MNIFFQLSNVAGKKITLSDIDNFFLLQNDFRYKKKDLF